jgi:hypothetical protein
VDAILDRCTQCGKGHLTRVTQGSRRQPDGGEAAHAKEGSEAVCIELVGLVDVAHHELCLSGVCQQGETTCCFDLVCNPVPIADALQGDRSSTWKSGEKGGNGSRGVIGTNSIEHLATGVLELKLRVMFGASQPTEIACTIYLLVGHRARLPIVVRKEAMLYYQIVAVVRLVQPVQEECCPSNLRMIG